MTRPQAHHFPGEGAPGLQGHLRSWSPGPAGPQERVVPLIREAMADKGLEPKRRPWSQLPEHSESRHTSASPPGFPGLHVRYSLGRQVFS